MNWLESWRNRRAVRRFSQVHVRDLRTEELERQGRWAQLAAELDAIAGEYAKLTRVVDYHTSLVSARLRRCEALVRAGQRAQAKAEAARLAEVLTDLEGPDGPTLRLLAQRLAVAERESGGG
ncbi:MAG: hypothetical protein J2P15_22015 [Micromonosporaceae bacterium]|nr:hypothetical protein [Micromonosporaceae bacterium]